MVNNFNELYYKNTYLSEFQAKVVDQKIKDKKLWLSLSQTCFYPEGGGQPGDIGILQNIDEPNKKVNVLDTVWSEGQIWHQVDSLLPNASLIKGIINFENRYDMMQQHSGEHIISGIVNRDFGYNNVGFNINNRETTFDFDGDLNWEQIEKIEQEANQAVTANIDIEIHLLKAEEQKQYSYRSKLNLKDTVRLVVVPGYDVCACAGTHVKKTGEIGQIKIIKRESYKGGVRLTVLCGQRSLKYHQKLSKIFREAAELLSANTQNFVPLIQRQVDEVSSLKKEIYDKNNSWLELYLDSLDVNTKKVILKNKPFNKNEWLYVCRKILTKVSGFVCLLNVIAPNSNFIFMHSENWDLKKYIPLLRKEFDFKGGGNSNTIQGPIAGNLEDIERFLNKSL